jgi:hypothetical protein
VKVFHTSVNLKFLLPFSVATIILSHTCTAQDSSYQINSNWTAVKIELKRRCELVTNLGAVLLKSSKMDKELLNRARDEARDLFQYEDTISSLQHESISICGEKNSRLTSSISNTLTSLDQEKRSKKKPEVSALIAQLESCESRLKKTIRQYNEVCVRYNRKDILLE